MATPASVYLPDGQFIWIPRDPHTWTDWTSGSPGESLRAHHLESDAGATILWGRQRPLVHGIATVVQSIPASTWTTITGLTELVDNYSGHSDTTNTGRYYVPATSPDNGAGAGDWYLCSGLIPFNSSSTADAHVAGFRVNGTTNYEGAKLPGGAGHVLTVPVVDLIQLSGEANDYVELGAWHNEAAAVPTVVANKCPSFQVRWVCQSNNGLFTAFTPAVPAPHTWTATDIFTASVTGANKVPLNVELRDTVRFLNNPPIFRVHASGTAQTLPTGAGVWTPFTWTGESIDPYGMWTSGASVTCQRAGLYYVAGLGGVVEPAAKAGYRAVRIHHTIAAGGSADYTGMTAMPMTGTKTTGTTLLAEAHIRMAVGDTLQLQFDHTQGAALSVLGASVTNAARMIGVWTAK